MVKYLEITVSEIWFGEGKRGMERKRQLRTSARKVMNKFALGLQDLGKSSPREDNLGKDSDLL